MSFLEGYQSTSSLQSVHSLPSEKTLSKDEIVARMKREAPKVKKYINLQSQILKAKEDNIIDDSFLKLSQELLNWNPEFYTIWNYRKELIIGLFSSDTESLQLHISDELQLTLLLLKSHPKSYWIWNHRLWCLKHIPRPDWPMEMKLIEKFFDADSRNFHAWQYRRVIVDLMKDGSNDRLLLLGEWEFTKRMIEKDIANYSAWHNRSKLINVLFTSAVSNDSNIEKEKLKDYYDIFLNRDKYLFIKKEWQLLKTAMYTDPDDSSVWFYIKWIFSNYFLSDKITSDQKLQVVGVAYNDILELNELEEDDGAPNKWCLITLAHLQSLKGDSPEKVLIDLRKLDPMRKNRYL
ncbi:Rab geranylgeranyltransferase [Martiniozyma asiatica (nom. inval.)]|nr:Rab geranylgeranyltransferase [Martiniozyma asiatica]